MGLSVCVFVCMFLEAFAIRCYILPVLQMTSYLHITGRRAIRNESVPKVIINDTMDLFFLNYSQHFCNFKP